MDRRYRAKAGYLWPSRAGRCLLERGADGARVLLEQGRAGIWEAAARFDTLAGHASQIATKFDLAAVSAGLAELLRLGLLEDENAWEARLREPAPARITTLAMITKQTEGRWKTLERCMRSYAENATVHGHRDLRILIADDADRAEIRAACRQRLIAFAQEFSHIRFEYLGQEEKEQLAGQDPNLRFLLFGEGIPKGTGITVGANRNAVLLATRGEHILMADDDTFADLHVQEGGRTDTEKFTLSPEPWPAEVILYRDRETMRLPKAAPLDVLAQMGAGFGPALRQRVTTSQAISPAANRALELPAARVTRVQGGIAGDNGGMTPMSNLWRSQGKRRQLFDSYSELVLTRTEMRAPLEWSLSMTTASMGYCLALDNRAPLAPFPPVGRDEDGGFAVACAIAEEGLFTAFTPWAVRHDPPEPRAHPPGSLWMTHPILLNELLQSFLRTCKDAPLFEQQPGRRRVANATGLLRSLAKLSEAEYLRTMARRAAASKADIITVARKTLEQPPAEAPKEWVRDVRRVDEAYERLVESGEAAVVGEKRETSICAATQQSYLSAYAAAWEAWGSYYE
jgi:hypothetical protein